MRTLIACLLLLPAVLAEEWDLSKPRPSLRAKRLREQAQKLWEEVKPTCELFMPKAKKRRSRWGTKEEKPKAEESPVDPQEVAAVVEKLELAALKFERSLGQEWNVGANLALCEVIKAWFAARPLLPKPLAAADEKARKKAESKARKLRSAHMSAARKRLMEYGSARRYQKLYNICRRCEGRKDLRNPLDKRVIPCQACRRTGRVAHKMGVVRALWIFHSPFYRADARRLRDVNRTMRLANYDPKRLAPFVRSVAVAGKPEFHDTWIRIHAKEKTHTDPLSKKTDKTEKTYTLYRIGKLWYLYHERYDKHLEVPKDEDEAEEKG